MLSCKVFAIVLQSVGTHLVESHDKFKNLTLGYQQWKVVSDNDLLDWIIVKVIGVDLKSIKLSNLEPGIHSKKLQMGYMLFWVQ